MKQQPEQRRSPSRPRASEQTDSARDRVLKTAVQLFLDRGSPLVSIDDIAKECGFTKQLSTTFSQ